MADPSIKEAVLAKDAAIILTVRRHGVAAVPELTPLVTNEDRQVRILALNCLDEAGDSAAARDAFMTALADEDAQVRATAARALHNHPAPDIYPKLIAIFDDGKDPYVKMQIPMIIARNDEKITDRQPLIKRWENEEEPEPREGLTVGLARLGHVPAQTEFVRKMHSATGGTLDRYLQHCEYIGQRWLLKPMVPILQDKTKLRYIGPHGFDVDLRACDIAVNLVAKISGQRFSFKVDGRTNYTSDQLAEVRGFLDRL